MGFGKKDTRGLKSHSYINPNCGSTNFYSQGSLSLYLLYWLSDVCRRCLFIHIYAFAILQLHKIAVLTHIWHMCIYLHMYTWRYCIHKWMHTRSGTVTYLWILGCIPCNLTDCKVTVTPMLLYIYLTCHWTNMTATYMQLLFMQTLYSKWAYRSSIFACMCQHTINCNIYFTCNCHVSTINQYAPLMAYICQIFQLVCVQIWDSYVSI